MLRNSSILPQAGLWSREYCYRTQRPKWISTDPTSNTCSYVYETKLLLSNKLAVALCGERQNQSSGSTRQVLPCLWHVPSPSWEIMAANLPKVPHLADSEGCTTFSPLWSAWTSAVSPWGFFRPHTMVTLDREERVWSLQPVLTEPSLKSLTPIKPLHTQSRRRITARKSKCN